MNIWGIIIGGATGFAIGGPIGALLGAAAGHYAEAKLKGPSNSFESKKIAFTVAIIALSAKMAKAVVLSPAQRSQHSGRKFTSPQKI